MAEKAEAQAKRDKLAAELRAGAATAFLKKLYRADLFNTDLSGASLNRADLAEADLRQAGLSGASLNGANLRFADLSRADLSGAELVGARLTGAILSRANLRDAELSRAELSGADLSGAILMGANLIGTKLRDAELSRTLLEHANLRLAKLSGARLNRAILNGATLTRTELHRADLSEATLGGAILTDVELPPSITNARHLAGSATDWRTVARSLRVDGLQSVLVRTGMPEVTAIYLIESLRTIDEMDLFTMLQSVFLSYGTPDEAFAVRLREALTDNGVKTWFYPRDAVPGSRHHRHIEEQINRYERMILCCSAVSLQREGVLHEVEEVLEREQDEGGSEVMIPVLLEPIFESGKTPPTWWPADKAHVYRALRRRVGADFRGAMNDDAKWTEQVGRVLRALRKRPGGDTTA